jgi:2-methylcitrate dehydratase PrpD
MAGRIVLTEDPAISAQFPAHRFARVRIRTTSGKVHESPLTAARGDPDSPLADTEIVGKFEGYTAHLGAARAGAIRDAALALGDPGRPAGPLADLLLAP